MLVINKSNYFFGIFNKTKVLIDGKRAATLDFNHSEVILPAPPNFEEDITICVSNFEKTVKAKGTSTVIIQANKALQKLAYAALCSLVLLLVATKFSDSDLLYGFLVIPFSFVLLIIYYGLFKPSSMLEITVIG